MLEPGREVGDGLEYHGYDSDAEGSDQPALGRRASETWGGVMARSSLATEVSRTVLPWLLSTLLGVLTAMSGSYIALSCDFLGDLRFGFCQGLPFADRNRCCGGSENVDVVAEDCVHEGQLVRWVHWMDYFNLRWLGGFFSFTIFTLLAIVLTVVAVLLVHEYCPSARGSGIPDVKAAVSGYDIPQSFSGSCLLVKTLGLALAVGAGLSLGKEGPLIHIGVCWAWLLARSVRFFGLPGLPLHDFACAGAAAGVSTAFGAPLGGVLFVAEELGSVRVLGRRSLLFAFTAAISASFTLKHLNLTGANRLTLFSLSTSTHNPKKEWHSWEMAAFLVIGLICGLVGVLFVKVNLWCTVARRRWAKQGRLWQVPDACQNLILRFCPRRAKYGAPDGEGAARFRPLSLNLMDGVVIAVLTAMINYPFLSVLRAPTMEAIHALFETCPTSRAARFGLCEPGPAGLPAVGLSSCLGLALASGLRVFQTSYTFGAALPSGLFIPSLFIGAAIGRLVGNLVYLASLSAHGAASLHIEPGVFAMVGAVAMLSGFCRMTVSLVVIMFELTGELTYLVPFMCAALAAKLVGDPMTPSIYDGHAKLNGIAPIEEQPDIRLEMTVGDVAVAMPSSGCIDVCEAVSLRSLQHLVRSRAADAAAAAAGASPSASPSTSPGAGPSRPPAAGPRRDLLLLVRQPDEVVGVVELKKLSRWLTRMGEDLSECSSPTLKGRRSAAGIVEFPPAQEPESIGQQRAAPAASSPSRGPQQVWFRQSRPPPEAFERAELLDARELVDTKIVRLSPHAPLLTAYCVFHEKPALQWCVVFDRKVRGQFAVLSRAGFEAALTEPRQPLARPAGERPPLAPPEVGGAAAPQLEMVQLPGPALAGGVAASGSGGSRASSGAGAGDYRAPGLEEVTPPNSSRGPAGHTGRSPAPF